MIFIRKCFYQYLILIFNGILLILIPIQGISGNFLTSVSLIFETFSPYAMIRFFEFSDKGWNISENCLKDMYQYLDGLRNGSLWAVKLYDATSYYSGGAFGGNTFRIYNPDLCRNLQSEYLNSIRTHWNLRINISAIPFPVKIVSSKYEIEMSSNFYELYTIQQLVCFPQSCNMNDLEQIMSAGIVQSNYIVRNISFLGAREVTGDYDFLDDGSFYILISLFSTVVCLFICAHFATYWKMGGNLITNVSSTKVDATSKKSNENSSYELESELEQLSKSSDENSPKKFKMHPMANSMTINNINTNNHVNLVKIKKVKTKNNATISLDIIAGNCDYAKTTKIINFKEKGLLKTLLGCFSLTTTMHDLTHCSPEEEEVAPVRGLQVIFTVLWTLGHTYTIMYHMSSNQQTASGMILDFLQSFQKQMTFLIDMFFFLSGANLAHLYFKTSCAGSLHVFAQLLHFLGMVAHKICSIILSYTIILIVLEIISKYFFFNSVLEIPSFDYYTCEFNKWRNVLFIDSFFPLDERCMAWSWFVSMEIQFFLAAALILLLAQIHPKYAGAICTGLFISSIVASTAIELNPQIPSYNEYRNTVDQNLIDFNLIYDKIWLRIPPYLLGMCLGYILYKTRGKFDINIFIIVFGWIACLLIMISFVFGFKLILLRINPWLRAGVITFAHTIWSVILCWIILASISQYGGFLRKFLTSKIFFTMGKLSNSVYLLGPLLIRSIFQSGEIGITLSGGNFVIMYLGFLASTYTVALLLHILFEAPLLAILRVLYEKHIK